MKEYINKLITGDCVSIMNKFPNECIDLVLSSPPYDNLRSYKGVINEKIYDEYFSFPFCDIVKELWRIIKPGGVVVWVVNDQVKDGGETGSSFRQALYFQSVGFKIYDTMIYHKNGSPFSEVGRYAQVFEYMFVFSKDKPKTVNLLKDKENKWAGVSTFGKPSNRQKDGTLKQGESRVVNEYGTRYNVWNISNGKGFGGDELAFKHPATFPENLAEDHILTWSNEGDIVLDPMNGGGTTTKMAYVNNRNYIGIDLNQEYVDIAEERIKLATQYTEENPNPKTKFIVSKKDALAKRAKKKEDKKTIDVDLDKMTFVHPNSLSVLAMTSQNQEKIKNGEKTLTSRSDDNLEGFHRLGNGLVIQLIRKKRVSGKDFKTDEERNWYAEQEGFGDWNNLVEMIKQKRTKTLTEKFLEGSQKITMYDLKVVETEKKEIETVENDDFWN